MGHETLGSWDGSDWFYYLPDALGSVRQTTDEAGEVTEAREWTPYGVEVGEGQEGLGYTGEWGDPYNELLDYHARFYDYRIGRFISADTIVPDPANPQSLNRYMYVLGNPESVSKCLLFGSGSEG